MSQASGARNYGNSGISSSGIIITTSTNNRGCLPCTAVRVIPVVIIAV
ncbi:MAG TPA: hypothetical protein VHF65_01250 [Nitrososphaera sp.]|nr:hypothetical protein [Nitrososphaera sp.]